MSFQEVLEQVKKKSFHPLYFLEGEESFYIDQISDLLEENVLQEHEKSFNLSIFYGRDTDPNQLMNSARQFPMGSAYQLILLKEAQAMSKLESLLPYIQKPLSSTILVISYKYGKLDRRTQFSKALLKSAYHVESKKLYEDKIPAWIQDFVQSKGFKIDLRASNLLADYLGNDLSKISGELNKLMVGMEKGSSIQSDLIEKNIGISREYNVFELGTALGARDIEKVYKILFYFSSNPKENPLVVTLGFLGTFFTKVLSFHALKGLDRNSLAGKLGVNPYFLVQYETAAKNFPMTQIPGIISQIRLADVQSKGVDIGPNTQDFDIMKELIYKILHGKS